MVPRRWVVAGIASVALLAAGCASPPTAPPQATSDTWAGRLALTVQDTPGESFAAGFELKGNPAQGELTLVSPIGTTLGILQWEPGRAVLRSSAGQRHYESLDALVTQVAGSPIPVVALFDWLRGVATPVRGWTPDLSQLARGRISALRSDPQPVADLRVVLER